MYFPNFFLIFRYKNKFENENPPILGEIEIRVVIIEQAIHKLFPTFLSSVS